MIIPTVFESFIDYFLGAMYNRHPMPTSDPIFACDAYGDATSRFNPWQPASIADANRRMNPKLTLRDRLVGAAERRLEASFPTRNKIAADLARDLDEMI